MHNQHVYNLVAKTIREELKPYVNLQSNVLNDYAAGHRAALMDLAMKFAKRFNEEGDFDPLKFLDKCSPDEDLYPLSELWEA
jgi:hypothetical protein